MSKGALVSDPARIDKEDLKIIIPNSPVNSQLLIVQGRSDTKFAKIIIQAYREAIKSVIVLSVRE